MAQIERGWIHVPLHGMTEEMRQQEESLFGSNGAVDVNFRSIQIASQRIRDVPGHDPEAVSFLNVAFNPTAIVSERNHVNASILAV